MDKIMLSSNNKDAEYTTKFTALFCDKTRPIIRGSNVGKENKLILETAEEDITLALLTKVSIKLEQYMQQQLQVARQKIALLMSNTSIDPEKALAEICSIIAEQKGISAADVRKDFDAFFEEQRASEARIYGMR